MPYQVYQHWDKLRSCIVGKSYPPEFYSFIKNKKIRSLMEKIAVETEEDYQCLLDKLKIFNVDVYRPNVPVDMELCISGDRIEPPPMTPRDYSIMLGEDFYFKSRNLKSKVIETLIKSWSKIKKPHWPDVPPADSTGFLSLDRQIYNELKEFVKKEISYDFSCYSDLEKFMWRDILDHVQAQGNRVINNVDSSLTDLNSAEIVRVGKDLYLGSMYDQQDLSRRVNYLKKIYPDHRMHVINTKGHADGVFCVVKPGLVIASKEIPLSVYHDIFPGWDIFVADDNHDDELSIGFQNFLKSKENKITKFWLPGEENNDDFIEFTESWISNWMGYAEETVFDVNLLLIDQTNLLTTSYNKKLFSLLEKHGITPHIVNLRHRYFWDGGLHCLTSDLDREGILNDWFSHLVD